MNILAQKVVDGEPVTVDELLLLSAERLGVGRAAETDLSDKNFEAVDHWMAELRRVETMSLDEAQIEAEREFDEMVNEAKVANIEKEQRKERLLVMISKVEAWVPPTIDHKPVKGTLLDQLTFALQTCKPEEITGVPMTGKEWRDEAIRMAKMQLGSARSRLAKECERIEKSDKWVKDLKESLPGEKLQTA